MKKVVPLALAALLCLLALTAAGGSGDPLISLSYLNGAYTQSLMDAVHQKLDALPSGGEAPAPEDVPAERSGLRERTLKEGDVLSGSTGFVVAPLGGEIRLDSAQGAVVDVTAGTEILPGRLLEANHRYIVAENGAASFRTVSPAAVASYEGGGTLSPSQSPDYYAIACALRDLGLFRGSGSGIGEGFDLFKAPTRGEGLVMFLRMLGEEEEALACDGVHPFTDVPGWLDPYVAWAWQRGYSNGVSAERFGSGQAVSATEYEEFLLRALGWSRAGADSHTTSLERAAACGALTSGEYEVLRSGAFTRAHAAYVSYYALEAPAAGGGETLAERLAAAGRISEEQLLLARSRVTSSRIFT